MDDQFMQRNQYRNAFLLVGAIAERQLGSGKAAQTEAAVRQKFERAFASGPLPEPNTYYRKLTEIMDACEKEGIPKAITVAYANVFVNQNNVNTVKDTTAPQVAPIFIASNSSEINRGLIFGDGEHAPFGLCMNARKDGHLNQLHDHVPFAYRFANNHPPAAIIFLGAYLPDGQNSTTSMENEARLAMKRAEQYVDDVRNAHHYMGDRPVSKNLGDRYSNSNMYFYSHVRKDSGGIVQDKVPAIAAVYDGSDRTVRAVIRLQDGTLDYNLKLADFINLSGFGSNKYLAVLAQNNQAHESNAAYPPVAAHSYLIKFDDCVDARLVNLLLDSTAQMKEIGSALNRDQQVLIAKSFSEGTVFNTHIACGYNDTVLKVHLGFEEVFTVFNLPESRHLRKLIEISVKKLMANDTGAYFGGLDFDYAVHELHSGRKARISAPTIDTLRDFMVSTVSDTRETLLHSIDRKIATINGDMKYVMPAAELLQNITRQLIDYELPPEHFDRLLAEQTARQIQQDFKKTTGEDKVKQEMMEKAGKTGHFTSATVADLSTGQKMIVPYEPPKNLEELLNLNREHFYAPGRYGTIHVKPPENDG